MKLLDIYTSYIEGKIAEEALAATLGISTESWHRRSAKHGERLPQALALLDQLAQGSITREQAALTFKVSLRSVNKLMLSWGIQRPVTKGMIQKVAPKIKWQIHKKYGIDFIAGRLNLVSLCASTGLSERQARRLVVNLLRKHYDMPWKDLAQVSDTKRMALARQIQEDEDLGDQKQRALKDVLLGKKTPKEAALEQITSHRARKKQLGKPNV